MKVSEIKKHLKSTKIEIRAKEGTYALTVWFVLEMTTLDYFRINAQANDCMEVNGYERERKTSKMHYKLNYPGFTGTYAARIEIEHRLFSLNEHSDNAKKLVQVIEKEVEQKNLSYVYPDCQMSQILTALESLGATVVLNETNGCSDSVDWRKKRREKWQSFQDEILAKWSKTKSQAIN